MTSVRGPHTFTVDEADRQALVLALAILALRRPGWDNYCGTIAAQLGDPDLEEYRAFKTYNGDRDSARA